MVVRWAGRPIFSHWTYLAANLYDTLCRAYLSRSGVLPARWISSASSLRASQKNMITLPITAAPTSLLVANNDKLLEHSALKAWGNKESRTPKSRIFYKHCPCQPPLRAHRTTNVCTVEVSNMAGSNGEPKPRHHMLTVFSAAISPPICLYRHRLGSRQP